MLLGTLMPATVIGLLSTTVESGWPAASVKTKAFGTESGTAVIVAVGAEVAEALPELLMAVTTTVMVLPMSPTTVS
jgi:hypothetical protein